MAKCSRTAILCEPYPPSSRRGLFHPTPLAGGQSIRVGVDDVVAQRLYLPRNRKDDGAVPAQLISLSKDQFHVGFHNNIHGQLHGCFV